MRAVLLAVLMSTALCGCQLVPSAEGRAADARRAGLTVVLVDCTGVMANPVAKARYRAVLDTVIGASGGGDTLIGDTITSNSLATSLCPLNVTFPIQGDDETKTVHDEEMASARAGARKQAAQLFVQPLTRGTTIMDAVCTTTRVFDQFPNAPNRRLLIISDMVEQSRVAGSTDGYDFTSESFSPARVKQIIDAEHAAGRLPELAGVEVFVAGATAGRKTTLSPSRIVGIERFWKAYFKRACGKPMARGHYGTTLLRWP